MSPFVGALISALLFAGVMAWVLAPLGDPETGAGRQEADERDPSSEIEA